MSAKVMMAAAQQQQTASQPDFAASASKQVGKSGEGKDPGMIRLDPIEWQNPGKQFPVQPKPPRGGDDVLHPQPRDPGDMHVPRPRDPGDMHLPRPRDPGDYCPPKHPKQPGDGCDPMPQPRPRPPIGCFPKPFPLPQPPIGCDPRPKPMPMPEPPIGCFPRPRPMPMPEPPIGCDPKPCPNHKHHVIKLGPGLYLVDGEKISAKNEKEAIAKYEMRHRFDHGCVPPAPMPRPDLSHPVRPGSYWPMDDIRPDKG